MRERERERESMATTMFMQFMYPSAPVSVTTAMSLITVASLVTGGVSEIRGKNIQYSKFWNMGPKKSTQKLSGQMGMLLVYTPAFLYGLASFGLYPYGGFRFMLLKSALTIHFFKRIFEVLFVHKYSGPMFLDIAIVISVSYFITTATLILAQYLTLGLQEPSLDLKHVGIVVFLMGQIGNFYHHYLLSNLRNQGDKEYKIPKGGLFNLVICPHYLFEILGFVGVTCIAQTWYALSFTLGTTGLLVGRSYATRKWTPEMMFSCVSSAGQRGIQIIIAGANGAGHLPGMVAALTPLPVIGVPVRASLLNGLDSLPSIVQRQHVSEIERERRGLGGIVEAGGFDSGAGGFDSSFGGFDSSDEWFDSSHRGFDSSNGGFDSEAEWFDSGDGYT
ncbi:uncharacterized protein LOC130752968 isoform X2 [Actinidia eriantha]|uniref:uncharacterized protein LOC130752968 isoform X2 n=1 Tax=Actinidia eriantha TaxID=165200 RepID=UPI00258E3025|nr:uncharacterized protein LOC130752968 isoform X2 [Actinidia eriantha]